VRTFSEETETDDSDYVDSQESFKKVLRRSSRVPKPKKLDDFLLYKAAVDNLAIVQEVTSRLDKNFWIEAMQNEYDLLLENKTWDLVDLLLNKTALTSKWILKRSKMLVVK